MEALVPIERRYSLCMANQAIEPLKGQRNASQHKQFIRWPTNTIEMAAIIHCNWPDLHDVNV